MAIRVTQIGVTAWVQNPSKIRVTQVGITAWLNNPSKIRVTQIGNEVWVSNPSKIRVTQLGNEIWTSANLSPTVGTGNADGTSDVEATVSNFGVGHADGVAVCLGTGVGTMRGTGNADGAANVNGVSIFVSHSFGGAAMMGH